MTNMPNSPFTFALILATGTGAAAITTQNPEMVLDGTNVSAMMAVAYAVWKLSNGIVKHAERIDEHQKLEREEWKQQAIHREREQQHWGRLTSTLAAHPDHATQSPGQ